MVCRFFSRNYSTLLCVLFVVFLGIILTCCVYCLLLFPNVLSHQLALSVGVSFCPEQFHQSFSQKLHVLALQENFRLEIQEGISKSLIVKLCPHCNQTFSWGKILRRRSCPVEILLPNQFIQLSIANYIKVIRKVYSKHLFFPSPGMFSHQLLHTLCSGNYTMWNQPVWNWHKQTPFSEV